MSKDDEKTEKYKGPGKVTAAIGRAGAEAVVVGLVGAAVGGVSAVAFKNTEFATQGINSAMKTTAIGGAVAGAVHGAFTGAHNASEGKKQYVEAKSQVAMLEERERVRAAIEGSGKGGRG